MRPGYELVDAKGSTLDDAEVALLRRIIMDQHAKAIMDWAEKQKPKIRAKFFEFLQELSRTTPVPEFAEKSESVAERIAKDVVKKKLHGAIRTVVQGRTDYSDLIHLLSIHLSRANVMTTIPSKFDQTPKLYKAISQEDHLFAKTRPVTHEMPPVLRKKAPEPTQKLSPTTPCLPERGRTTPFAVFPNGTEIKSTTQTEFIQRPLDQARSEPFKVHNVLNTPTCL